jgi:hypothetical protein
MERRPKMKKATVAILGLAFLLILTVGASAQESQDAKALRKEVVRLKYVRAEAVRPLLYTFLGRGGQIQSNSNIPDVITISDTPENVEKILAAIREIDVKPADILFTVQLVLGSETDDTTDSELARDPIIRELRGLLRYRGYTLLDATLLRGVDEAPSEVVMGRKADFELYLRPVVAKEKPQDSIRIELRLRQNTTEVVKNAEGKEVTRTNNKDLIRSNLNIKSGDRTVVGVSKLDGGDKGLILIISGKVVE